MTVTPFYLFYSLLAPVYISEICLIMVFLPLIFGFAAIVTGILNIKANFETYSAKIGLFFGVLSVALFGFWLLRAGGWYV